MSQPTDPSCQLDRTAAIASATGIPVAHLYRWERDQLVPRGVVIRVGRSGLLAPTEILGVARQWGQLVAWPLEEVATRSSLKKAPAVSETTGPGSPTPRRQGLRDGSTR